VEWWLGVLRGLADFEVPAKARLLLQKPLLKKL
jgi:hypothetical protein